ncbi:MAG TPA: alpha/beta hydrolase-fold protein [Candidatus Didemnitutus sp.]|nr:alpha/beta hydrolase-fold protein [Candidatus Didemnitutus sp.]
MTPSLFRTVVLIVPCLLFSRLSAETPPRGSLTTVAIDSQVLRQSVLGVDPHRTVLVYLPPGYAASNRRYPVIYYFHSFNTNPVRFFADERVQRTFDQAIATGAIREFIVVVADYSLPMAAGFFENSPVTGRWLDFTELELVPFIDAHFQTLAKRESRGLAGDGIGGYGALKCAMLYPDLFSVVYALHPVGTGTGVVPMSSRPDWAKIHRAKTLKGLEGDPFSGIFVAMAQAYLPNPSRPPFYCDYLEEMRDGKLTLDVDHVRKLQDRFLLDHLVVDHVDALRRMRGIAFDWGRYDSNPDHVYSNQAFTRKLDELGIDHLADEYRGNGWNINWTEDGRVATALLPFFGRHLEFR